MNRRGTVVRCGACGLYHALDPSGRPVLGCPEAWYAEPPPPSRWARHVERLPEPSPERGCAYAERHSIACLGSVVALVHDRRGCLYVCANHAAWRSTTSVLFGHASDCPSQGGPS